MLDKFKEYLKEKWEILKPILVNAGNKMKDAVVDFTNKLWYSIKFHVKNFVNKIWNIIKNTASEIKTKVLIKEMAFLENIADWLLNKADKIFLKINEGIEDIMDNTVEEDFLDGDSDDEEPKPDIPIHDGIDE